MGKKTKDLQKELTGAGITLTGDEKYEDLVEMSAKLKKDNQPPAPTENKNKGGSCYVWLKLRAYVTAESRVELGLYKLPVSKVPKRFRVLNSKYCEIFEEKIGSRTLAKIAKSLGVDPDKYEENEELLEVLAKTELKPFK